MNAKELESIYGQAIAPKELAKFLGLDPRTVIKYAHRWGGVEVAPGTWRFFDKLIMEVLNAEFDNETRTKAISWQCISSRDHKTKIVSRCHPKVIPKSAQVGARRKSPIGTETSGSDPNPSDPNRHGLLDDS
jgi:hypothetical protein